MSQTLSRFLQILGITFLVVGILIVADGLLPLRSQAPNPFWIEIAIGLVLSVVGWAFRKVACSRLRRAALKGSI